MASFRTSFGQNGSIFHLLFYSSIFFGLKSLNSSFWTKQLFFWILPRIPNGEPDAKLVPGGAGQGIAGRRKSDGPAERTGHMYVPPGTVPVKRDDTVWVVLKQIKVWIKQLIFRQKVPIFGQKAMEYMIIFLD